MKSWNDLSISEILQSITQFTLLLRTWPGGSKQGDIIEDQISGGKKQAIVRFATHKDIASISHSVSQNESTLNNKEQG